MPARIFPVVLAGGAGTRFWPASRRARPKPFVPLVGDATLIDATLERIGHIAPPERTCVVSASQLAGVTREALRRFPGIGLLLEPEARGTAAAVAWGAAWAAARDPEAIVGIFPADHHIPHVAAFVRSVTAAARASADGQKLMLIGIEPSRPDTAYGYIRLESAGRRGATRVRRFVEKPRPAVARRYVASGDYLWNAGMVVARPQRILEETRAHAPEVWGSFGPVLERLGAGRRVSRPLLADAYRGVKPISFDHAVLERSRRVYAIRGRFRWSDLGSWDSLGDHLPARGPNRVQHPRRSLALDAAGNVVWTSGDKHVVLLGVDGLVVVDTPDALLVCSKERAQEVRRVVDELARRGRRDLT